MQVNQTLKYTQLLDVYGNMLTEKQHQILTDYLCFDNTLSEIANAHNTTRQAVNDIISRSFARLDELEEKLAFCKKLNEIKLSLTKLQSKRGNNELKQQIAQIIQTLED